MSKAIWRFPYRNKDNLLRAKWMLTPGRKPRAQISAHGLRRFSQALRYCSWNKVGPNLVRFFGRRRPGVIADAGEIAVCSVARDKLRGRGAPVPGGRRLQGEHPACTQTEVSAG